MSRSRQFRAPFVVTVASVVATLATAACGGSTASDGGGGASSGGSSGGGGVGNASGSGGSGNVSGTGGQNAQCPPSFPGHDTACPQNGLSCSYSQGQCCPPWEARCVDGKWEGLVSSCNPPPPDPCPATPPAPGTACGSSDPCGNDYQYCTYDTCQEGTDNVTAQCQGGVWTVESKLCSAPCEKLTPCQCFKRADCEALTDTCLCECDYNCPGTPPCACACGGGKFLGCQSIELPD